ncbi:MAG TPA: hypothetical protein VNQ52_05105 [Microbacteriaceae bacterium]|nr:hypothetical protein [Microbacteriaceae bacterium]
MSIGAAVGIGGDWKHLNASVTGKVWNYYSGRDQVLGIIYPAAQALQKAIGRVGINTTFSNIVDVDVAPDVDFHSASYDRVELSQDPTRD